MSQYQLWLHYRDIDRQLHTQLDELEAEFTRLSSQLHLFDEDVSGSQNEIIQALLAHFAAQDSLAFPPSESSSPPMPSDGEPTEDLSAATVSQALFAWSRLPNFDSSKELQEPMSEIQPPAASLPPTPNPDLALLPDDMVAFIDANAHTAPQVKLPWWLRNTFIASNAMPTSGDGPVDQQSLRTNLLIQRWLARRARLSTQDSFSSEEEQSQ